MKEEQKKIELLQKIAHRLNEAHVQWALGASMLLYFKSITSEFHDIDLMVAERNTDCVRTILSEMGEFCPSDSNPTTMYRTKTFMEFLIDSVEVDVMAGFAIVKDGKVYDDERIAYYQKHIKAINTAVEHDGVDLMGYLAWSPIDFLSSHKEIRKRYGFVYVDRDFEDLKELKRYPKKSFYWYKKVIESQGKDLENDIDY